MGVREESNLKDQNDGKMVYLNQSLDKEFKQISGLQYLPWVGKDYLNQDNNIKVLIVAESVYDWNPGSKESYISLQKDDFARVVVREHGMYFLSKDTEIFKTDQTYRNLERAIYGRKDIEHEDLKTLWLSVSLHQYVQRYMANLTERPSKLDYETGAIILKQILAILKPRLCIFLGTDWRKVVPILNYASYDKSCSYEKIGRSYPRVLNYMLGGNKSKIIMIQHTSKFFSWRQWHAKFLSKEAPEYITYMVTPNNRGTDLESAAAQSL